MTASEKLRQLLAYFGTNKNKLGSEIGKRQTLYDIGSGKIKSFSPELIQSIKQVYPNINDDWFLYGTGSMVIGKPYLSVDNFIGGVAERELKHNPTKKAVSNQLKTIIFNKTKNGTFNYDEVSESDFVQVKRTIVTIKGFAGLKNAFFPDDYIENNFETEYIQVAKEDAGKHYYRIQVKENNLSMIPMIEPDDWTDCVEIDPREWGSPSTFKSDKIYCFWHPLRGILFKKAVIKGDCVHVELSSLNPDKNEYPNEEFNLAEFKKIFYVDYVSKKLRL